MNGSLVLLRSVSHPSTSMDVRNIVDGVGGVAVPLQLLRRALSLTSLRTAFVRSSVRPSVPPGLVILERAAVSDGITANRRLAMYEYRPGGHRARRPISPRLLSC